MSYFRTEKGGEWKKSGGKRNSEKSERDDQSRIRIRHQPYRLPALSRAQRQRSGTRSRPCVRSDPSAALSLSVLLSLFLVSSFFLFAFVLHISTIDTLPPDILTAPIAPDRLVSSRRSPAKPKAVRGCGCSRPSPPPHRPRQTLPAPPTQIQPTTTATTTTTTHHHHIHGNTVSPTSPRCKRK